MRHETPFATLLDQIRATHAADARRCLPGTPEWYEARGFIRAIDAVKVLFLGRLETARRQRQDETTPTVETVVTDEARRG